MFYHFTVQIVKKQKCTPEIETSDGLLMLIYSLRCGEMCCMWTVFLFWPQPGTKPLSSGLSRPHDLQPLSVKLSLYDCSHSS